MNDTNNSCLDTCLFIRRASRPGLVAALLLAGVAQVPLARADDDGFRPGNLLVSRVVYDAKPSLITPGVTQLPPNCVAPNCVTAIVDATYPQVFNNTSVDATFGITSKIMLDQLTRRGELVGSLEVPKSSQHHISTNSDQMVGSFSSKSEVALNLSTDKQVVTFMGYLAPLHAFDVSNTNTPFVIDPTNLETGQTYRIVAAVDARGHFQFTKTNAYSGDNGRAAILNNTNGASLLYTAGNAGNGSNPQPNGIIVAAGAQIMTAAKVPLAAQPDPGLPTPVGSFNVTQLGLKVDKIGKDTNFRGLTIFNNVVYYTKGSGSNGVNTVYFVDTSGFDGQSRPLACPNGTGLPNPTATLPASPINYTASLLQTKGVFPYNTCVLSGFPTTLAKAAGAMAPFGVWFANATTLYVADEGNGTSTFDPNTGTYTAAAAQTTAGLQKWVFDTTAQIWKQKYVLTAGLDLGVPYAVKDYPTGENSLTGLPWAPATDGLRNLTGHVNRDGTATIWAITSTVSGSGDVGADPNRLVRITDSLAATGLPADERFRTVRTAGFGEVLRGVSFTPGTGAPPHDHDDLDDHDDGDHGGGHDHDGENHDH
jgi:hypothetical protein